MKSRNSTLAGRSDGHLPTPFAVSNFHHNVGRYPHIRSLDDLPPYLLGEIEGFFAQYNQLCGRAYKPVGRGVPDRARALLDQ